MKITLLDIVIAIAFVFCFGWTAYFIFVAVYNLISYLCWRRKKNVSENARREREREIARSLRPHGRKAFDFNAFCAGR